MSVSVIHLVWGPLGLPPLERFVDSYLRHPAGVEHDLVIALNGVANRSQEAELLAALRPVECTIERMPEPVLDLAAYRIVAERVAGRDICLLNSYSRVQSDGWLAKLAENLASTTVGIVGATASNESISSQSPLHLQPVRRLRFPAFPNPHIRVTGMMLERELMLDLRWPVVTRKLDAWGLESGRRSVTRQIWQRGLEAFVVGRDGKGYGKDEWFESATFRSGDQSNLLIADNRSDDFETADAVRQIELTRLAWGSRE